MCPCDAQSAGTQDSLPTEVYDKTPSRLFLLGFVPQALKDTSRVQHAWLLMQFLTHS